MDQDCPQQMQMHRTVQYISYDSFEALQVAVASVYVSGELQANVVSSIAVSHEVSR